MTALRRVVGDTIRRLREERSLTQLDLAHGIKTSITTVVSIEKAHTATNLDLLERIADQLKMDPAALIAKDAQLQRIISAWPRLSSSRRAELVVRATAAN